MSSWLEAYDYVFNELADPRVEGLLLMRSPLPVAALVAGYVYLVRRLGPRLMRDRPPARIERLVQAFDLAQILANAYIFYRVVQFGYFTTVSLRCEPVDTSWTPRGLEIVRMCHMYFMLKVSDLVDTIFFVVRKKNSHVSFLHVYHHAGMVIASWAGVKFLPGGHGAFVGVINTAVHVVMYLYYLLSSLCPDVKSSIRIKKTVTLLQLTQFALVGAHLGQLFFSNPCRYPMFVPMLMVPQNLFMVALFVDFYRKAYLRPKQQ